MISLAVLRSYYPDEVAFRIMVREGSAELLRALRGEPRLPDKRALRRRVRHKTDKAPKVKAVPPEPVRRILADVAGALDITVEELTGRRRWPILVDARAVAIKLIRERVGPDGEPKYSTPRIGAFLNRDHSTVLHALDNLDIYFRRSPEIKAVYEALTETGGC